MKFDFNKINPLPPPSVDQRIKCKRCGREKHISIIRENVPFELDKLTKKIKKGNPIGWKYTASFEGYFCTQTCATIWANNLLEK